MKKTIIGYIVMNKYGAKGLGVGDWKDRALLWLGGADFSVTLFSSRKKAQNAIKRSEAYALEHDYGDPWFKHTILPVSR